MTEKLSRLTTDKAGCYTITVPIIYVYAALLILLNFIRIFDNNFWGDEAFSIRLAGMSVSQMLQATAGDVHPPLYYLILIAVCRLLGRAGWVYHLTSLIPYLLFCLFALTVLRERFGKMVVLLSITFASLLQNALVYNVEVRMYSWAALFVLLSFYSLYLVMEEGRMWCYLLFTMTSLAAAYTHYYAMMSVAFFYLALLVLAVRERERIWKVAAVYGLTVVGYAPWLVAMLKTFERTAGGFWLADIPSIPGCLVFFFETDMRWLSALLSLSTFLLLTGLVARDLGMLRIRRGGSRISISLQKADREWTYLDRWLVWGAMSAAGTILLGEMISYLIRPAFMTRYLYPVACVLWLVLSITISRMPWRRPVAIGLWLLIISICLPRYLELYKEERAQDALCAETKACILDNVGQGDMLLTDGDHLAWTVLGYYVPDVSCQKVATGFEGAVFDHGMRYWIVWTKDLIGEELSWLEAAGYMPTELYHGGVLGDDTVHFYRLEDGP